MKNYSYITVLSNWLLGYDKYSNTYRKDLLSKSTYPNEFYLLDDSMLDIGLEKAIKLLKKININNNIIIRIETQINSEIVKKNTKNGKGYVITQNFIPVSKVYFYIDNQWKEKIIEDVNSLSYLLKDNNLYSYEELTPRTLSILPIAFACQAKCKFCFSESSISFEQEHFQIDMENLRSLCTLAKLKGADRFVITGGGEPGILKFSNLLNIVREAKIAFNKIVLITNAVFLSKLPEEEVIQKISQLIDSGLSTLCISYHHYNSVLNKEIMGLDNKVEYLVNVINSHPSRNKLKLRLICVLQKKYIDSIDEIDKYINFACKLQVEQVCFKELYVSSTTESLYANNKENIYCLEHQTPLNEVIKWANQKKAEQVSKLPWGSPIFKYYQKNQCIEIAAYTEPSVGWEKYNKIARSWNILSDGKCYVSLEDKSSLIN